MSKLAFFNLGLGFIVLFIAASAGAFISLEMTNGFIHDPTILEGWSLTLMKSAHGHTNLFGILHILFGLTLSYSRLSDKIKLFQTLGLCCGTLAMSIGLIIQAWTGPQEGLHPLGLILGALLSMTLIVLASHAAAMFSRVIR